MPLPQPTSREPLLWPPAQAGHADRVRWHGIYSGTQATNGTRDWSPDAVLKAVAGQGGLRDKVRVQLAADICRAHASLLFGKAPQVIVSPDDTGLPAVDAAAVQARAATLMEDGGGWAKLTEAEEIRAWAGGVWLRAGWDADAVDHAFLEALSPLRVQGDFRHGRAVAGTITTVVAQNARQVWRWLERHERQQGAWVILHGLYLGSTEHLGRQVPLDSHPATAHLDSLPVDPASKDGRRLVVPGNVRLLWYVKGQPNRKTEGSPQGEAVFAPAEDLLASLDMQARSLASEFLLGKRRIVVDAAAFRGGQTADDIIARDLFTTLDFGVKGDGSEAFSGIETVDFKLRVTEHLDGMRETTEMCASRSGLAPQSLGLEIDGSAESGTALRARKEKTTNTSQSSRRAWQPVVTEAIESLLVIDREVFRKSSAAARPALEWAEIQEDGLTERAAWITALFNAGAASIETLVREAHDGDGWTDDQIAEEADRIRQEKKDAEPNAAPDIEGLFDTSRPSSSGPPAEPGTPAIAA